jgi:hypothetical protein
MRGKIQLDFETGVETQLPLKVIQNRCHVCWDMGWWATVVGPLQ